MKTLDDRARRAAESLQISTSEYTPAAPFATVVRRHHWAQVAQGVLAFAAVIVFIVAGAMLRPTPTPDVAEETPDPIVEETPDIDPELPNIEPQPDTNLPIDPFDPEPKDADPLPEQPAGDPEPEPTPPTTTEPADVTPPPIVITTPKDGERFDATTIWFEGTTEPGATVAAGPWEADVDGDGNWAIKLILSKGTNRATFTATDAAGNQGTASVVVYYDPPPPPKDDKPKEDWEFTAHQVYGSCAETPPYDVFWGTAKPGTTVTIISEYGSGSAEVDGKGEWEVKVHFKDAPLGKVFSVKVKDAFGSKKYFEFVYTEA